MQCAQHCPNCPNSEQSIKTLIYSWRGAPPDSNPAVDTNLIGNEKMRCELQVELWSSCVWGLKRYYRDCSHCTTVRTVVLRHLLKCSSPQVSRLHIARLKMWHPTTDYLCLKLSTFPRTKGRRYRAKVVWVNRQHHDASLLQPNKPIKDPIP